MAEQAQEDLTQQVDQLLERVQSDPKDRATWMKLAIAYRQMGDHSHQVWAWSRAVQHRSTDRHCRKWGHLLRFTESPDHAVCLYCNEKFVLGQ